MTHRAYLFKNFSLLKCAYIKQGLVQDYSQRLKEKNINIKNFKNP